ncbi:hypothetical protein PI125_g20797 [Phytophthora idaei]|nr:hypothetical protein PI125_g20797 [Phytophthora idaei]KAG3133812.1 hypothetical protein PI126_g18997 [Phytophthora idaei]
MAVHLVLFLASLVAVSSSTELRHSTPESSFEWVLDPHAAERCANGSVGCVNHVKYGYTVVPVTVSTDAKLVMQSAERPARLSAVVKLETFTQPGCVISGCHTVNLLGVLPQEDCFNQQMKKVADQPDGKSVKIDFGGIYYEHLPSGELYVKYERRNYLTGEDKCTYEIRSGYKRWF